MLRDQEGDATDYGTPTSKRLEERSQSSKKGAHAFARVADLSKSHDLQHSRSPERPNSKASEVAR